MKLPAIGILLTLVYGGCTFAVAAPQFPELSARVIDQVGLFVIRNTAFIRPGAGAA